jgi:hypothetical protein
MPPAGAGFEFETPGQITDVIDSSVLPLEAAQTTRVDVDEMMEIPLTTSAAHKSDHEFGSAKDGIYRMYNS